jgi:hypothetical protein
MNGRLNRSASLIGRPLFLHLPLIFLLLISVAPCYGNSQEFPAPYSVAQLVAQARRDNYRIRADAEKVYRARQQVRIAMGRLLPSLRYGIVMTGVLENYRDLVPALLGFLFPHNWFRWKENKLYSYAERLHYGVLIANEINVVHTLAYRLHSLMALEGIYQHYNEKIRDLVAIARERFALGEDSAELSLSMANVQLLLEHDLLQLRNERTKCQMEIAYAIALPPGSDWQRFALAPISLPDLSQVAPLSFEGIIERVLERSFERTALVYLKKAAHYSSFTRAFQFLAPTGDMDGAFGFGYPAYVSIGRSNERELAVRQEQMDANLSTAARKFVSDHNTALELYKVSAEGFVNAEAWYEVLVHKYREGGEYEPTQFLRALDSLMSFHSRKVQAQHYYLISRAQVDRLEWRAPYYHDVLGLVPKEAPLSEKSGWFREWWRKLKRKKEDAKIQQALDKREFALPDK